MFEQIVRPSETPRTLTTRRILSTREVVEVTEARAAWGKTGQLPTAVEVPPGEGPFLFNFTVKEKKEHNAVDIKTQRIKVVNPDDNNQYVVTERIKSITFREKKASTIAAYPEYNTSTATQTQPGASPPETWQPGETQVNTDGTGPLQPGETRQTYPLKVEDRTYNITWPTAPNEIPL